MADTYRLITSPVRPSAEIRLAHLAALASGDALCRWARAQGLEPHWVALTLAGDLAGQHATERELARAGLDRATLGRDAFVERVREHDAAGRARLAALLDRLAIQADLDAGALDRPEAARAAVTAFVRLYEQGRLHQTERVVEHCPRCETVVDPLDAEPGAIGVDCTLVDLRYEDGQSDPGDVLRVGVETPELLPGAVAVAVPLGHESVGRTVSLPLTGRSVPVIGASGVERAVLVIPGHDAGHLELARDHGLTPVVVLDGEGVVQVEGPLAGLPRYAARAAAEKMLADDGWAVGTEPREEPVSRCRRCGTVVVSRLGLHWFLAMDELELAAADAIRDGGVVFSPAGVRDEFLARAGTGGEWCLSHQVWAGQPVPVARCLDCNGIDVTVDGATSCGKCMGMLAPDDSVLDARFVGAVAVLAAAGWPDEELGPGHLAPCTTLLVGPGGAFRWGLPIAALGLRLAGAVPFSRLAVHDVADVEVAPDSVDAHVDAEGGPVVRTALVSGGLDVDAARGVIERLSAPLAGGVDLDELDATWNAAFSAATPQLAVAALARALDDGIPLEGVNRLRRLAEPVLGAPAVPGGADRAEGERAWT